MREIVYYIRGCKLIRDKDTNFPKDLELIFRFDDNCRCDDEQTDKYFENVFKQLKVRRARERYHV